MAAEPRRRSLRSLSQLYLDRHPQEAARRLEIEPPDGVAGLLAEEPAERAGRILSGFTPDAGAAVLGASDPTAAARLLRALDPNDAARLLARLPEEARRARLDALDPPLARELRELMSYPADSAGALMDPRVLSFRPEATVRDVIRRLRTLQRRRVQDVFVTDPDGRLAASIPLQDVVLSAASRPLEALVSAPPVAVQGTASREEVVETLQTQRVGSLPVVDFEGRLLGVLRQDELLEAAQRDATADLVTMVGAGANERALSPPLFAVRKRLPWLQINLLTAFLAAAVVGLFEDTIARFTALAVLLPVVAGQSGNTGAQALAVTMRGLALREVRVRQWLRVSGKELAVGAANGVAVALTTAVAVYVWSRSPGLALVIGTSMVLSMTIAGLAGAAIPMLLTAAGQDPAQSSSIILTTVTDVSGFFSFLGIATVLAGLL